MDLSSELRAGYDAVRSWDTTAVWKAAREARASVEGMHWVSSAWARSFKGDFWPARWGPDHRFARTKSCAIWTVIRGGLHHSELHIAETTTPSSTK